MNGKRTKSELKAISTLRNLRQVRHFLGMSLSEISEHIPSVKRKSRSHIGKSMVAMMEAGDRPIHGDQLDAIKALIALKLQRRYGRDDIGVNIIVHSPWRVKAYYYCYKCRQFHLLKSARQRCRRGA